jgi:hypothetical protein
LGGRLAYDILLFGQLIGNAVELLGDPGLQIPQTVALTGDSLAGAKLPLLDGLSE